MDNFARRMMRFVVDNNSQYFTEYLQLISSTIDTKTKNLDSHEKKIRKEIEGKPAHYKEDADDYLADLSYKIDELEQMLYRSFVISIFIFMEDLLSQLCMHLKKQEKQKFAHTDLKGNGVDRSIKYLEKVLGTKFPKESEIKEKFDVAWVIRNALVHADGQIKKQNIPLIKAFIKKNPEFLSLDFIGKISITYKYAQSMIDLNTKFAKEISDNWLEEF
jgi:hypothetical protein